MEKPILSICIPTYNRAAYIAKSLTAITSQVRSDDSIEIIVADNYSQDDTESVVRGFVEKNPYIKYVRREENLGAARNFLALMHQASGEYILLLGDDDILSQNAISVLLNRLKDKHYGVLYIESREEERKAPLFKEYNDQKDFIKAISYFYTFMSSCIFRKDIVETIDDPERYIPSHLLQMPFYIKSTLSSDLNAIIREPVFETIGLAATTNGGYNFFDVFVHWYLAIWGEYLPDKKLLAWLKKDIWLFVWMFTRRLLIDKNVGNFKTENGWQILFEYYGREWYFWWTLFKYPFGTVKRKIKKML